MMAIFTLGADEIRIRQMEDIAEAWGFAGKYTNENSLLNAAKKNKFDYVLVMDYEALEENTKKILKKLEIEIISFKDKKKLEGKILEARMKPKKD